LASVGDKGEPVGTLPTSADDKDEAVSHTPTEFRRKQVTKIQMLRDNSHLSESDRCEFLLTLGPWYSQDTMEQEPLIQPHLRLRICLSFLLCATIWVPSHTSECLQIFLCGHRTSIPKPAQRWKVAWSEMSTKTVKTTCQANTMAYPPLSRRVCACGRRAFAGHSHHFVVGICGHSWSFAGIRGRFCPRLPLGGRV